MLYTFVWFVVPCVSFDCVICGTLVWVCFFLIGGWVVCVVRVTAVVWYVKLCVWFRTLSMTSRGVLCGRGLVTLWGG